jgi:enoyl-CoA hydratase/carnithine racemase
VHEIAADAPARAYEIARSIAAASPFAVEKGMEFVQKARGLDWQAAGLIARKARDQVFSGDDFREGIRAFREKRTPRWPSGVGK